jgi:sec-independent protein translocase protein TatA
MELAIILLIAVLLFGANKIPKLARSTGQAMGEFQRGREEIEQELEEVRDGSSSSGGSDVASSSESEAESESTSETEEE